MTSTHNERKAIVAERIFDGQRWHDDAAVLTRGERIVAVCPSGEIPSNVAVAQMPKGVFVAPGFIDLQVNGGGGVLLNDDPTPEGMRAIARAHRRLGTTAILPTLITDARGKMETAIAAARAAAGTDGILGLHLEGPFINPSRAGVHARAHIVQPEPGDLESLRELGCIGRSLITLAPECVPEGFIRALAGAGLRVAAGHSEASAACIMRALEDGLAGVTHLFNAMPPFLGRAPGLIGATLAEPRLIAGLIVDGLHVDPMSVRAAFAAKGSGGIALVTDAMPTVGAMVEQFQLTGRTIALRDGRLVAEDGTLAGAHLDLGTAVRNAVTLCDIPLEVALCSASLTPSRFLGLEQERGALIPNARADLVAIDASLKLVACWFGSTKVSDEG